jgi:hypothetical protein
MRILRRRAMRRRHFNLMTGRGWFLILALAGVAVAVLVTLRAFSTLGR